MAFPVARFAVLLLLASITALYCKSLCRAQIVAQPAAPAKPVADQVALVRVHLPVTGSADQVLQATISRVRDRLVDMAARAKNRRRPTLVLQLEPHAQTLGSGAGSQFERVLSLARFLCSREMAQVKTVAFVPRSIRGHGSLLALACEEIVMAPEATLGEAGIDESREAAIGQTVIGAYREIAESRRTIPTALALGMIDAAAEVLQIDGFVSAQRFQLAEPQVVDDQPYRYLAMYEIESDGIEQTIRNMMAAAGGLQMSDAMDTSNVHIAIVQSVTGVVT